MRTNVQIIYRKIDHSDSVNSYITKRLAKIERIIDDITLCRVVIEAPHQDHHKGQRYHITVDLALPNQEIVVSNDHHDKSNHEDMYVALRDAFNALTKQVMSKVKRKAKAERLQPVFDVDECA